MSDGPSIAAIVVPWSLEETRIRIATLMGARGFAKRLTPMPTGYRPLPTEWVGLAYIELSKRQVARAVIPNTAIVLTDVARIFHFALTLSTAHPEEIVSAWRRFSGFEPCAKVLWGGRPRWKDGEDQDHEGDFYIPSSPPTDLRWPSEARVPLTAAELSGMLLPLVKPLRDPLALKGESWLHKSSPLA
jgi:hypothetical protein